MTTRAWQLLALSKVPSVMADFGCGSGLSTGVLAQLAGRQTSVMGLDAAGDMLCIAAKDPALAAGLCLSDFREGAPLRQCCLDAAISISALQWLFVGSNGGAQACSRFFTALASSLRPGARCAFQLYVPGSAEVEVLLACASAAGFHARWIVDFPHANPAKKYFLCLRKREPERVRGAFGDFTSNSMCPLAWPHRAGCSLTWAAHLAHEANVDTEALQTAGERVREEHARHADHAIRVLRRAATALLGGGLGEPQPGRLLTVQGPAVRALVPCAGPLHVWLSVHSTQAGGEDSEAATLDAWSEAVLSGCRQSSAPNSCQTSVTAVAKGCGNYVHRLLLLGTAPPASPANPWLGLAPMQISQGALWLGRLYCQKQAPMLAVVARHSIGMDLSAHLLTAGRACHLSGGAAVGVEVQVGGPGSSAHSALLLHIAHDDEAALESAARDWVAAYADAQRETTVL